MKKMKKLLSLALSATLLATSTATTLVNITASAAPETSSKTEVYSLYDFENMTNEELANSVSNASDKGLNISADAQIITEIYTAASADDKFIGDGNKSLKISADKGYDWPLAGFSLSIDGNKLTNASSIVLKVATPEYADGNGMYFQLLMKDGSVYTIKNGADGSFAGNISTWNGTNWIEKDCGAYNDGLKYVSPWEAVWVKIPLNAEKMTRVKGDSTSFDKTQIAGLIIAGQSGIISDTMSLYIDEVYAVTRENFNIDFEVYEPEIPFSELSAVLKDKHISILGDSMSTYEGYSNNVNYNTTIGGNEVYYGSSSENKSIIDLNETWWMQTIKQTGMQLLVNNSYSGDSVMWNGRSRALQLHCDTGDKSGTEPDVIAVYLGINDCNANKPLDTFTERLDEMIAGMVGKYENSDIFLFTLVPNWYTTYSSSSTNEVLEQYNAAIKLAAIKYNCTIVDLYNESGITKDNYSKYMADGNEHPNNYGMDLITKTLLEAMADKYLASAETEIAPKTEVYSLYNFENMTSEELANSVSNAGDKGLNISADAQITTEIYTATSSDDKFIGDGNKALKISADKGYDWPLAGVSLSIDGNKLINASSIVLKVATPESAGGNGMYFQLLMKDGSVYTIKNGEDGSRAGNISTWDGTKWEERDCGEYDDGLKYVSPWEAVWVKIPLNAEKMTRVKGDSTSFDKTQIAGLIIAGQSGIISDTMSLYIDEIYAVMTDKNTADFEILPPARAAILYDFENMTNEELANSVSNAGDKGLNISADAQITTEIYTAASADDKFIGDGNKSLKISADKGYDWPLAGVSLSIDGNKLINASSIVLKVATPESAGGNGMYFQLLMKDGSVYTIKNGEDGSRAGNISTWDGTKWEERDCGEYDDGLKYVSPWEAVWVKIPLNAEKMTRVKGDSTSFDKTQIAGLIIAGQSGIISDTMSLYLDEVYAVYNDDNTLDYEKFYSNHDVNGDGTVNATDLTVLRQALLNDETDVTKYDVNGDKVVDVRDLVRLKKIIAGII